MQALNEKIKLFHGSYCKVEHPDLSVCGKYKDFGQGFYLTSSYEQAESFVQLSLRKAMARGIIGSDDRRGYISSFLFHPVHDDLKALYYDSADASWLHCVVGHRKQNTFPELVDELSAYDMIAGKIANDNTNATITAYMAGTFGAVGSKEADGLCIGLLLPERLQDQYCFRTNRALECLSFAGSEEKWIGK